MILKAICISVINPNKSKKQDFGGPANEIRVLPHKSIL